MTFLAMSRFSLYFWRQLRLPKHQHGFDCKNGMAIRIGWRMLQCFHKNFFKRCCVYLSFAGGVFGAIGERLSSVSSSHFSAWICKARIIS